MEERCGQLLLVEGLIIDGGKNEKGAQGNIQREKRGEVGVGYIGGGGVGTLGNKARRWRLEATRGGRKV